MKILLVVYDNGTYINVFPQGLAYIAAILLKEGYKVEIYSQDFQHYPDEHLTQYLDNNRFDVVGVSVIGGYYQYRKLLKISEAINKSKNRPFYIIGGHGPSPEPEYFLEKTKADVVVIGEGEVTIVKLLEAWGARRPLSSVKGIAYQNGSGVVINERQPLVEDIDSIPFPAFELFPIEYYRLYCGPLAKSTDFGMRVLSSRGCTFLCNFCYRLDKGFRPRSNESVIEEILLLKHRYGITYINFADELLMSTVERTVSLCEYFLKADVKFKWICNGRLNFTKPEVLKIMKRAGCIFINYGIEAMDNQVLRNMNKALTTEIIITGIEATLKEGISPGLNIIFGNIGDNKNTLNKAVKFLLKYDDGSQLRTIRPVTPYPGSPLYYYAIEKNLLKDCADFYENKHVNSDLLSVNFTEMSDDEFHQSLFEANQELLTNYYQKKLSLSVEEAKKLYSRRDVSFRGFSKKLELNPP